MSFLSYLFGKKTIVQDEVFGTLTLDSKEGETCHFLNENLSFICTGQEISCSIEAGPQGPVQNQRIFFQKIIANYNQLTNRVKPLLESELTAFHGRNEFLKITDFNQECQLVGIDIPQIGSGPVRWSWSFKTIHDLNHMATISMVDDIPQTGMQFDGQFTIK